MNKKGFTLIEIIICISLILVIGTGSFFGVRLISKNIRIKELKQITQKAIEAAQVYIETNDETYQQIYGNKNGAIIPLNVLVNEGLLNLDNTDLKQEDIEDEYVLSMLSTDPDNDSDCIDVKTVTSWSETSSEPIYICIKKDGTTNLMGIGMGDNLSNAAQEKYYYKGDAYNNYATIDGKGGTYRILYIDTDDSIVLVNENGNFSGVFEEKELLPIYGCTSYSKSESTNVNYNTANCDGDRYIIGSSNNNKCRATVATVSDSINGVGITSEDIENTKICYEYSEPRKETGTVAVPGVSTYNAILYGSYGWLPTDYTPSKYKKIHLNTCMKIKSGTGDKGTPFVIKSEC